MADQGVDVTVILGFLYLGSKKTARNKAWIRLNVRYILNCTPTRDADPVAGVANYWEKEGLAKCVLGPAVALLAAHGADQPASRYMRLPVFDSAGEELKGHVDRACAFIEEARYHGPFAGRRQRAGVPESARAPRLTDGEAPASPSPATQAACWCTATKG